MKLIVQGQSLAETLIELIKKHTYFSFAVAWASAETDVFKIIKTNNKKIKNAVIGTHFYQTHPAVLESFAGSKKVRFVFQPQGVFHPKVYLLWSNSCWDLLIGSANLTAGALSQNSELMLYVSSGHDKGVALKNGVLKQIEAYWEMGEVVTGDMAEKYRSLWMLQQSRLRRISGTYSSNGIGTPPIHTEIMSMSWSEYYRRVQADPYHGYEPRCDLLDLAHIAFKGSESFSNMELGLRKTIAGLPNDFNEHAGWFGSMKGSGYYHQAINNNDAFISRALDCIPLAGAVTRKCYDSYVEEFVRAFPNGRHGVGTASRLLAFKRPDYFVCLDSKNKSNICKDFGIRPTGITYERYWGDLICRIHDSARWNSPEPKAQRERRVWKGRAAMLDAIFYEE